MAPGSELTLLQDVQTTFAFLLFIVFLMLEGKNEFLKFYYFHLLRQVLTSIPSPNSCSSSLLLLLGAGVTNLHRHA